MALLCGRNISSCPNEKTQDVGMKVSLCISGHTHGQRQCLLAEQCRAIPTAGSGYQPSDPVPSRFQLKLLGTAEVKSLPESAGVR